MSLPLLRKEAREHGPVLAATAVIGLVALFTILGVAEDAGGRFVGLARFLLTMGPLIALVLANRLLVREYSGRTQFFLETLPRRGYLESVRDLAHRHGALLVFDEVVTALRLANGGAQEFYGVLPDLACLGKSLGNGMPLSALVAPREAGGFLRITVSLA